MMNAPYASVPEHELIQPREEFDADLRPVPGAGKSALTKLVVPVALGAAVVGGILATMLMSRLLRRQLVLVQLALPEDTESGARPSRARAVIGSVIGASARAILPHVAELVAQRVAEHAAGQVDFEREGPRSSRASNGFA